METQQNHLAVTVLRSLMWCRIIALVIGIASITASEVQSQDLPRLFADHHNLLDQTALECDAICSDLNGEDRVAADSLADQPCWQLLPDGLLWHSYLADPHEPRISTVIFHTNEEGVFWDATLGGRVGLMRYGSTGAKQPHGWQWDLEGAVMTRLDLLHAEDVESMDYRFGTEITAAEGPWAMKFGYFHISSHVGDEYLIRHSVLQRVNYVTESWIIGGSYRSIDAIRLYGEFANAFRASGGAKRYQFQTGLEYAPRARSAGGATPFAAIHFNLRQAVDYDVATTAQLGWSFQGPDSDRRLRLGIQWADGPTSQYAFFQRRQSYIGVGVWFDY